MSKSLGIKMHNRIQAPGLCTDNLPFLRAKHRKACKCSRPNPLADVCIACQLWSALLGNTRSVTAQMCCLPCGTYERWQWTPAACQDHLYPQLCFAEITNTRVAFYSLGSLLVCITSGVWQLWYLRKFFQRKKLL